MFPARFSCGWMNRRGAGCPRNGYSPPKKRSKLVADGEWDARNKFIPRPVKQWKGESTGSKVSTKWVLPAEITKQAGCGRGVGREKEAYSPPGQAVEG